MNKKIITFLFIIFINLFLVSAAYAGDCSQLDESGLLASGNEYDISSDLSNDDIQLLFDNANDGDTFKFTAKEYDNISLVVDKKLNIISENSVVNVAEKVTDKAESLGISQTFGFYFTSTSSGSVLSGLTIKAYNSDNAIIVNGTDNVKIDSNVITGGKNSVLVQNSEKITLSNNKISQASENGMQLKDIDDCEISKNSIWNNKRSGIEIINMYNSEILRNEIHHNGFNGISMYGVTSGNLIKYNIVHNNTNGLYIDSKTNNDQVLANTLSHNRRDPNCELGPDESGNGLLFGDKFRTGSGSSKLLVKNNALMRNEQFQAKNNPFNEKFELDQNWFDSADPEHTFVCPMLLAKILKLDAVTVKNGIGLQVKDDAGSPIDEMATFNVDVEIDGNKYTATVQNNGQAEILSEDLEPNKEYDVDVILGDKSKQKVRFQATSGPEKYTKPAESDNNPDEENPDDGSSNQEVPTAGNGDGTGQGNGKGSGTGNGQGSSNSSNSDVSNSGFTEKYGSNSSDVYSSDSSLKGKNAVSKGDVDAGSSSEGSSGDVAKAYEVIPEQKISKSVVDTSGVVILSVLALLCCFVYGYKRKEKFD